MNPTPDQSGPLVDGGAQGAPMDPFEESVGQFVDIQRSSRGTGQDAMLGRETQETTSAADPDGQPQHGDSAPDQASDAATTQSGEPALPEGVDIEPLPEHMKPEHAYAMARHWQRQASLAQNKLKEAESATPAQNLEETLAKVLQRTPQQQAAQEDNVQPIERPKPPARPEQDFGDEWDKYQLDLADYNVKMAEYLEYRDTQFDQRLSAAEQLAQQQRQQAQLQQQIEAATNDAMSMFSMDEATARGFVQSVVDGSIFKNESLLAEAYKLQNMQPTQPRQEPTHPNDGNTAQPGDEPLGSLREEVLRRNAAQQQRSMETPSTQGASGGAPPSKGLFTQRVAAGVDPFAPPGS